MSAGLATSPLSAYRAAERYVVASAKLHPQKANSLSDSQCENMIQMLNNTRIDPDDATELIEALNDESPVFNQQQRESMSAVVISAMEGGTSAAVTGHRTYQKEQANLFLYNYFPSRIWRSITSDDSMTNTMRNVAHFLVGNLRLRNANAPTKRLVISIIHSARGQEHDPDAAYNDLHQFASIMKQKRDVIAGTQSLGVFPEDPQDFILRFPDSYPESDPPIECPISLDTIMEFNHKEIVPARSSNKRVRVAGKTPPRSMPAPSHMNMLALPHPHGAPVQQQLDWSQFMQFAQDFVLGRSAASSHDVSGLRNFVRFSPGHRRAGDAPENDSAAETEGLIPLPGHARLQQAASATGGGLPGCLQSSALTGGLSKLRAKVAEDLHAAPGPAADTAGAAADDSDEPVTKRRGRPPNVSKRPSASTPPPTVSKRPAASSPSVATSPTAVPKKKTGRVDLGDSVKAVDVLKAKQSIFKYPWVVEELRKKPKLKGRPAVTKEATHYHGGRIYYSKATDGLRVLARAGDRHEQRLSIDFKAKSGPDNAAAQWALACAIIETDSRPVEA